MGKSYEVSTHVADPKNSCRGIIKLPASLVEGNVLVNLRDSNPTINILAARKMGSTDSFLVTFEGSKFPFYIDYLRTDLCCRRYRQNVEACAKCRKLGHRKDVCPNVTICLCPKCGTPDPPEDYSCTPTCIICNGTHETGSSECRLRYKPRTTPPAPPETKLTLLARKNTQASSQQPGQEKPQSSSGRKNSATAAQVLSSKQAWPPLTPRNEQRPPINHTKVSWAGVVSHNSSSSQDADSSLIKCLLNQNEMLKAEIKQLKAMFHPPIEINETPAATSNPLPQKLAPTPTRPPREHMDIVAPTPTSLPTEQMDTVAPAATTEAATPRPPSPHLQPPPAKRKNAEITDTDNTLKNAIFVLRDRMPTLENKLVALENRLQSKLDAFSCEESA
ncbi:hypothetical protein HPB49_023682 [Dermacentor silvarum]|uniref:Uncharacterized protein n=1 Tax=Dermacentor silvarum TaxID=543639 RepID=A0ACB8D0Q5_DERSI|nr:hypothetical protein HPB49_023682 [Dermacentor silvarum]